jgi:hypothetical protein
MMKYVKKLVLACMVLLLCGHAIAYDSYTETYQIMGCRSYLEGRDKHRGWLIGYLTAYESQRGTNVLASRTTGQIFSRFDSYCRANPRRNMDEAAEFVIKSFRGR